ncbi:MAG: MarR family transcriptional regulator [Clostridiales bacterium]|nr:MarR family transcriptional regulator [Clostridiales bacterium]
MKNQIHDRMKRIRLLHHLYLQRTMPEHDLYHGQLPVLEYIRNHEGCTQVEVAQALSVSPASIATSTKRMQSAGLLEKAYDQQNLRIKRLRATPRGIECSDRCRRALDTMVEESFKGFSAEELGCFDQLLGRVLENLSALLGEDLSEAPFASLIGNLRQGPPLGRHDRGGRRGGARD